MGDIYWQVIERIRDCCKGMDGPEISDYLKELWNKPYVLDDDGWPMGCLFRHLDERMACWNCSDENRDVGCLTQIKGCIDKRALSEELTERIRKDNRIPEHEREMSLETLEAFAEYQREVDMEIGRWIPEVEVLNSQE